MRAWFSLFTLIFSVQAFALTQEEINYNIQLMNQQSSEIASRLNRYGERCDRMFAPLPGRDGGTVAFHTAIHTIEQQASNLQKFLSQECLNQLMANIATLPPDGTTALVLQLLRSLNRPAVAVAPPQELACTPAAMNFSEIERLVQTVRNMDECRAPAVGQGKRVTGRAPSNTRNLDYLLVREADKKYRAVLNVNFVAQGSSVTAAQMMARARACLAGARTAMKGPDGSLLVIDLLTPTETEQAGNTTASRPAPQTINILPGNIGSSAANYQENIPCPTLVHEMLHLLGLCDEYSGGRDGFACRARGPSNSIMSGMQEAFSEAVPRRISCVCEDKDLCRTFQNNPAALEFVRFPRFEQVTNVRFRNDYCSRSKLRSNYINDWMAQSNGQYPAVPVRLALTDGGGLAFEELSLDDEGELEGFRYDCPCSSGDVAACQSAARALVQGPRQTLGNDCPAHTQPTSVTWGAQGTRAEASDSVVSFDVPARANSSLLLPSHFNRIIGGSCPTTTPRYDNCAQYAYQTDPAACADAPGYCQSASWLQEEQP